MKKLIKKLIPPILFDALVLLRRRQLKNLKFDTYGEAALACRSGAYQSKELVKVIVEKNLIYKKQIQSSPVFDLTSLRTLIALAGVSSQERLNVIDFGGGGGNHYFIANTVLELTKSIRWNVVETTAMALEAQRIADKNLKFFDDIEDAKADLGEIDLVFTSSALQYCPDPLSYIRKLIDIGARYLFITRTPFVEGENSIITIQRSKLSENGPGPLPSSFCDGTVTYPITYVSKSTVEELLKQNYEIRFTVEEGKGVFGFNNELITMTGYFCVRK